MFREPQQEDMDTYKIKKKTWSTTDKIKTKRHKEDEAVLKRPKYENVI